MKAKKIYRFLAIMVGAGALLTMSSVKAVDERKVNVRIEGPSSTIIHQAVDLPPQCAVTDSAGKTHTYTGYRAVCALQVLQEQGRIAYQVTDWGFALALDRINTVANAADWSQTWFLRHNHATAEVGIDGLILAANDELLLAYGPWPFPAPLKVTAAGNAAAIGSQLNLSTHIWSDTANQFTPFNSAVTFYINNSAALSEAGTLVWTADGSPSINIRVEAPGTIRSAGLDITGQNTASHVATKQVRDTFEVERGVKFMVSHQAANGALSESAMVNDWAAIALSAQNYNQEARNKIKSYLLTNPPAGEAVTDSLRRAMALMALDVNPYDVNSVNYIQPIIDGFAAGYLGKKEFINEEVFALLILRQAGFERGEKIIAALIAQVMAAQQDNGSWADSTDMTAAAIQALLTVRNLGDVGTALERAEAYLRRQQTDYGGFNNSEFSTAWAIQALAALGKSEADWYKNSLTPGEFLGRNQAEDGGMSSLLPLPMRLWSTATVIPAALNKSWLELLSEFSKGQIHEPLASQIEPELNTAPLLETNGQTAAVTSTNTQTEESPLALPPSIETVPKPEEATGANELNDEAGSNAPTENQTLPEPVTAAPPTRPVIQSVITETTSTDLTTAPTASAPEITLIAAPPLLPEDPIKKTARNIFRTAATLTTTLGAYLAWRLLQTMV